MALLACGCICATAALLAPAPVSRRSASLPLPLRRLCYVVTASEADDERRKIDIARLQACMRIADLEEAAEQAEAANDLVSAIEAYEELLVLQPPDAPGLREQDAARRALQQLCAMPCWWHATHSHTGNAPANTRTRARARTPLTALTERYG